MKTRLAAARTLRRVLDEHRNLTDAIPNSLDNRDRSFVRTIVDRTLRHLYRIDYAIKRSQKYPSHSPPLLRDVMRTAVASAIFAGVEPYAAVNTAVEIAKRTGFAKQTGFVNAVLRKVIENWEEISIPSRSNYPAYLSIFYSFPKFIVERWRRRFPDEIEPILDANNALPPRYFRVNEVKIGIKPLYQMLAQEKITIEINSVFPNFFELKDPTISTSLWKYVQDGLVIVQDAAFGIAPMLLAPQPGDRILDIGTAPGGKLSYLFAITQGKAEIVGLDKSRDRLGITKENLARWGIDGVELVDDSVEDYRAAASFDRVLVDAPCSGFGTVRRHPEITWHRQENDIKRLAQEQKAMLIAARKLLRPGGRLVWSTCTTEIEENEQIAEFAFRELDMLPIKPPQFIPPDYCDGFFVRTYPHRHNLDGAFVAVLKKV